MDQHKEAIVDEIPVGAPEEETRTKVLVVDDIMANIIAINHVLSDLDIDVISTTDPYEALTCTFKHNFALALIDIQMPRLDGYQTAEMMQSAEHSRQIPIIFVTANSLEDSNIIRGYDVGAVDYITKPLNPYILKSKVKVFVELYNSKRALSELNDELEAARSAAVSISYSKSELLANLSSALRTPMHSIIGMTDMGVINIDKWDKRQQTDNLREINNNGRKLLLLLNDIIDLSKLEAGLMKFDYSTNDMVTIVNDVAKSLKPLLHEKEISINIDSKASSLLAEFDTSKINQVLLNIFSNAMKASQAGDTISVTIGSSDNPERVGDTVRVTISDQGAGIPAELQEEIFNKFIIKQIGGSEYSVGAGIGLSICKRIIEYHAGSIGVRNDSGCGAEFYFEIPVTQLDI